RVGVGAIDAAGAAWRHRDRRGADNQAAHGNGIRRRHENRAARSGALRAGGLDRRNVEAARKQQHGGESEQEFHRATPLEGRPPRRESPGIGAPQATPTWVSVWFMKGGRRVRARRRRQTYLMELSGLPRPSFGG